MAFLSVYMLAWSVLTLAFPEVFSNVYARFYGAVSAVASVALLVISLMDFAQARGVLAEKLEANAIQIQGIMRALERELEKPRPSGDVVEKLAKSYVESILDTKVRLLHP